jgi:tripeptidyl-peptidase-1
MHFSKQLLPAFFLAISAAAFNVVHERREAHPSLIRVRRLEPHVTMPLKIALKQRNTDALAVHLTSVSDPYSPLYGQHWSAEDVAQEFAPADETRDAVTKWLTDAGFGVERLRVTPNKAWIHVSEARVDEVEALLGAKYHVYTHESGEEHAGRQTPFLWD